MVYVTNVIHFFMKTNFFQTKCHKIALFTLFRDYSGIFFAKERVKKMISQTIQLCFTD